MAPTSRTQDSNDALLEQGNTAYDAGDLVTAFRLYEILAVNEHQSGYVMLAHMHRYGYATTVDKPLARDLLKKAADAGNSSAMYSLGSMHYYGEGIVQDTLMGLAMINAAAALNNCDAERVLGFIYSDKESAVGRNHVRAVAHFKRAADLGCSVSKKRLAALYKDGTGTNKDEEEAAESAATLRYLGIVGIARDAASSLERGLKYLNGAGVEQSDKVGFNWIKEAAGKGDRMGDFHLGLCYLHGRGVEKNSYASLRPLLNAASKGYAPACHVLGVIYEDGVGIPRAEDLSAVFFLTGSGMGDAKCGIKVALLKQKVKPSVLKKYARMSKGLLEEWGHTVDLHGKIVKTEKERMVN